MAKRGSAAEAGGAKTVYRVLTAATQLKKFFNKSAKRYYYKDRKTGRIVPDKVWKPLIDQARYKAYYNRPGPKWTTSVKKLPVRQLGQNFDTGSSLDTIANAYGKGEERARDIIARYLVQYQNAVESGQKPPEFEEGTP